MSKEKITQNGLAEDSAHHDAKKQSQQTDRVTSRADAGSGLPQAMPAFAAYKRIFRYGLPSDHLLQGIACVAATGSGVGIAMQAVIFGSFITTMNDFGAGLISPAEFRRGAGQLALYFVYLGIGRLALSYAYNIMFTYAAHRVTRNIRLEFLRAALRQEVAFFDFGHSGSVATQATSNGRLIQGGLSEKLGLAIQGIASLIAAFVVSMIAQWKLTLICLCIVPAALVLLGIAAALQASLMAKSIGVFMRASSFVEGVLGGIRVVHSFEMRERLVQMLAVYLAEGQHIGRKLSPLFGIMFSSQFTIIQLGFALAFWRGVRMLASGEIEDSGTIFTVIMSVILASTNLTSLGPHIMDFSQAASAAAKLFAVIDRDSDIDSFTEEGLAPAGIVGTVELSAVSFAYPTRPDTIVLDNFSLVIPAGKVTAFVGASGSGKSTIIALLERWYDPTSGMIKLDSHPINQYKLNWLRTSIRLVQQEPVLFRGTVADNIKHGLCGTKWEKASGEEQREKIEEAARIAFAHDFITTLPDGYDTEVGQRGGLLSGGQKQRIAIARSIVSDPKLLLLDEATSALDPHAEEVVQQALDRASRGRTTIVIAHKLATVRKADNIVLLDKGKIVEQGTHGSLIANDGPYARLAGIQDLTVVSDTNEDSSESGDAKVIIGDVAEGSGLRHSATRSSTAGDVPETTEFDQYDYDLHQHLGIFAVIYRLLKENRGLTLPYILTTLSILGGSAVYPAQAMLLSKITAAFSFPGPQMTDRGDFFSYMFVVVAAGCFVSYFTLGWSTNIIAQALNNKYRKQMFSDILRQDIEFFDRPENSTGALASKTDTNPQSILELMGFNIALIGIAVVSLLACVILALAYSWKLGVVVIFAGIPPLLGVGLLKVRSDATLDRESSERYSSSAAVASEAVTAIRTVSSLAIEKNVLARYGAELDHAVADSKLPLCRLMIWFGLMQALEYWFMALGFWYGCRLLSLGEIGLTAFLVSFLAVFFAGLGAAQLFQHSTSITKGLNAANYIFWLHGLQPRIQPTDENRLVGAKSGGHIEVNNIYFSYPLRKNSTVLRGVSIEAKRGQFIALVGASGCGKSTIIAMLERFYDVSSGCITIDKEALPSLNPRLFRTIVALVPQKPILFDGTVRENIALGAAAPHSDQPSSTSTSVSLVPDESIESALRSANAWDFVSSLPEGVNTPVGVAGSQFSGGQRQRIAIARALVRNPKILLLDEATSALDTESEKTVQCALDEASQGKNRITFAVAHRLSTVRDAGMICVFHHGRIVEAGTHTQLVTRGGMYKKMCEAQALS